MVAVAAAWLYSPSGYHLTQSLRLLTVEPQSDRRVDLGFTVANTVERPELERQMVELINRERTSQGLRPLEVSETARGVARDHSRDMLARGYFSHLSLEGKTPFQRMLDGKVRYNAAGENLALAPTVELAHDGLMDSPGHRANILSSAYGRVGIGVIDGGNHGLMITQNFTD